MLKTNHLYNENCLETMAKMPDGFIDLIVTSPPYDGLRDYKGFAFNFPEILCGIGKIMKRGGVVVWIVGDETKKGSESGTSFKTALSFMGAGFNLHDTMIYQKSSFSNPSNNRYHQVFEYMFVFTVGKPKTFNPIKDKVNVYNNSGKATRQKDGTMLKRGERCHYGKYGLRTNVWRYPTGKGISTQDDIAFEHPAIFPEQLVADHIYSWSNPGDLVYDPMSGSGTTLKMAIKLNRNFIGSEISAEYCKIATKRINAERQKIDMFKGL